MTTESKTAINERVEAGAAWLDRVDPDWLDRIDLKRLDLAEDCGCVMGQVVSSKTGDPDLSYTDCVASVSPYGADVRYRKDHLPRGVKRLAISHEQAVARGFHNSKDDEYDWDGLTKAWKRLIKARRRSAPRSLTGSPSRGSS